MKNRIDIEKWKINEMHAETAFTRQSKIFDELYSGNKIIRYKRERVREHLSKYLSANQFILELNSGTGEDALWMAQQNCQVHCTDISAGMLQVMSQKIKTLHVENRISYEVCSFSELENLQERGPFDMIFSNFAGLNCTGNLKEVLSSFSGLLKPGGIITLVILPKFCLWEFLLLFKGKFKTATRRFFSRAGRSANIEKINFKCWYYNPSYIIKNLKKDFKVLSIEGLCTIMPPSYIEYFAENHPTIFSILREKEKFYKSHWPWKYIGDYYIISLQQKNK